VGSESAFAWTADAQVADDDGDPVSTAAFDEFGSRVNHTGTADSAFGYTGAWTDADTALVHLRARDYDPATGQFLTVDPAVDQTRQPYAYTGNSPLTRTDPTGLDWWGDVTGTVEGVTIAALSGFVFPNAWNILRSDDPAAQVIGGWALGVSGANTTYGEGSGLVDSLRSVDETRNAQATIIWQLQNGSYTGPLNAGYAAGSPGLGNSNFTRDASTFLGWSTADPKARLQAALGSYELSASVICVEDTSGTAVIEFSGKNTTTLGSAIGIDKASRDFWNGFADFTGIGTAVTQTYRWREQVSY